MPDWRKASQYSFPDDFPRPRWAWEFLRRNLEYRKDWADALVREAEAWDSPDVSDIRIIVESAGDAPEDDRRTAVSKFATKWLLQASLFDPNLDHPPGPIFEPDFGLLAFMLRGATFQARGLDFPIAEFNLRLPLAPQLEAIEGQLRSAQESRRIQPRKFKNHRKHWVQYLRLLDADLDGRTPKQIADALQGEQFGLDEKKVWDQLRSARKLTWPEGYMAIFLAP